MYKGTHTETHYVPEPSVQVFEIELGKHLAQRLCNWCGKPLGAGSRVMVKGKHYARVCYDRMKAKEAADGNKQTQGN